MQSLTQTRTRAGVGAAGALVLVVTAVLTVGSAEAQPNPYGDMSTDAEVTIATDGGYRVAVQERKELVRDYELAFGGAVHDGFRLPDIDGQEVPPYLRSGYALDSFAIDGEPVEVELTRLGHRIELISDKRNYPEGVHTASFDYTVTGASVSEDDHWTTYFRSFDGSSTVVRVRPPEGASIAGAECFTVPPASNPCGRADGDGWVVEDQPDYEGIIAFELDISGMQAQADQFVEPVIDGG